MAVKGRLLWYLLEALGVSPTESTGSSPSPSHPIFAWVLSIIDWHGRASEPFWIVLLFHAGLVLPHIDHGGDWCLGLRRRQKLQFQPHPSLQHLLNGRLCPGLLGG